LIATAATNGAVVIWNIVRDGQVKHGNYNYYFFGFVNSSVFSATEMTLTEHIRAVNRVSWYPANSNLLLTGSQDGTMKLWVRLVWLII
jgi:WD40 repeat protein